MKTENELMVYTSPQVEIIEVEVEKGFANSGNVENPYEDEVTPW